MAGPSKVAPSAPPAGRRCISHFRPTPMLSPCVPAASTIRADTRRNSLPGTPPVTPGTTLIQPCPNSTRCRRDVNPPRLLVLYHLFRQQALRREAQHQRDHQADDEDAHLQRPGGEVG